MLGRFTLRETAQGVYSYRISSTDGAFTTEDSLTTAIIRDGVMTDEVLASHSIGTDPAIIAGVGYCVANEWGIAVPETSSWLSSELLVDLTAGSIYQDPAGGDGPPASPTTSNDTYLTGGFNLVGTPPNIVGAAVEIGGGGGGPDAVIDSATIIDATWGSNEDLNTTLSGNLMLGQITMTGNTQGTFKLNFTLDEGAPELVTTVHYGGAIVNGTMYFAAPPSAFPTSVPGDTDNDGDVDAFDAAIVAGNWQLTGLLGGNSAGDFDNNGVVNDLDATILAANFGYGTAAASAVPEPSTISLLLLLLAALTVRPPCRITRGERS